MNAEFVNEVVREIELIVGGNATVNCTEVLKNNGVRLHGITILMPGENISPTVYIENYIDNSVRNIAKKIIAEIAKARENKGLSQRQLANAIGISNAALSKIESGETEIPNPKILKKISKHIDLNYNDMMSMIGLGTQITMLNPFIKNYYEHLKGDKLEDAWIIAKSSIDNNNIMINNLNNDINDGNLSEEDKETALETIQDLEYQNTTNKLIIEILDNTRYKEAKNNAKNKNVL